MRKLIDLTGQTFGRWIVLERAENDKWHNVQWFCRCNCGREKIVRSGNLRSGDSKGCRNCYEKKKIKHGQWRTRLYVIWQGMTQRCENPNHKAYKNYGGRGISVCLKWRNDFKAFMKWALANGYKENLTIDRIDNNKGYSPENCQFLTKSENSSKGWEERRKSTNQTAEGNGVKESIGANYERTRDNGPNRQPG